MREPHVPVSPPRPPELVVRAPLRVPWFEVVAAALPAALHAVLLLGRLHPDEVFQSLDPAMNKAFGFGVLAWEWQVGLRNHAVPIVFSWLLRAASAVGLDDVVARRSVLEVPQLALHAAMLGAVWRFSARRVGPALARPVLWLTALYGPVLWFGGRTMSESFSVAFIVWGLERLDDDLDRRARVGLGAGALLGLSVVARYGSAAVIAPAMVWLLVTRRFRLFGLASASGLVVAGLLGLLDRLTWGDWFHSFIAYVDFNVLSGKSAAQFGALPWWYYLQRLVVAPWAGVGFFAWRAQREQRTWLFVAAALGYFAVISATAHKEDRFVYPTLALLSVAGVPAFVAWASRTRSRWSTRSLVAGCLLGGAAFYVVPSPWEPLRKEQFQLQVKASRGVTGFVLMNEGLWGSGGFFYLGKDVPWCPCELPQDPCFQMAAGDPRFNRGIYWSNGPSDVERNEEARAAFLKAGFRLVEQRGSATLFER